MTEHIHHIERVEFAVSFYVPGADKIGLMKVVEINRFSEIRIFDPFGDIASFF